MNGMVRDLNRKQLESEVLREGILLIDCTDSGSEASEDFDLVLKREAKRFAQHRFVKFHPNQDPVAMSNLGLERIPALLLYRDGLLLYKYPGYYDEDTLREVIWQAESLDIKEIKKRVQSEPAYTAGRAAVPGKPKKTKTNTNITLSQQ